MIKNNSGVTLVALSVTIIVMLIIASVTYVSGRDLLDTTKIRSYITTMYLVKGEIDNISETFKFDGEKSNLKGSSIDLDYENPINHKTTQAFLVDIYKNEIFADLPEAESISKATAEVTSAKNADLWYMLTKSDLEAMGIENDMLDDEQRRVFIVNYETGFIAYSSGYTNKGITTYSLDGLLKLK